MNWDQLKTIFWLRWRLTRNQWAKSGGLGAVLSGIIAVTGLIISGASFLGAIVGGCFVSPEVKPAILMGIWFAATVAFLFFWLIGLIAELQRSETIDLQRLMHLPVALGQMFVVNYAASHFVMSILLMLPMMTGFAIGLIYSQGFRMALMLPLTWSMIFMVTAWTYCLRGWLATLMSNPRRRRTVIMAITMSFVLLGQLPNLYFNVYRRFGQPRSGASAQNLHKAEGEKVRQILAFQKFIPPCWVPVGAQALAEHNVLPALLGTVGCAGIGVLGLRRAYRSTVRFYQGDLGGPAPVHVAETKPEPDAKPVVLGTLMVERRPPLVPEQAAAVALATLRSMLRAPEVKMAWASSFIATAAIGAMALLRTAPNIPEAGKPFVVTGAVAFSFFLLIQFLANQFGFDRHGFRALVLTPVDRKLILLGKNLANLPVGGTYGLILILVISIWLKMPVLTAVAALFQLITLLALGSLGGNLLSIFVPYRIQSGSMKPTKMPALAMLTMVVCQLMFPLILLPAVVPPGLEWLWRRAGYTEFIPVNLVVSVLFALVAALIYWLTLEPLGQVLRRREIKILNIVTAEQE